MRGVLFMTVGLLAVNAVIIDLKESTDTMRGFATHGTGTFGGRGGKIITLYSAASLRDAVISLDPTIIRVGGCINLTELFDRSPGVILDIRSYKTIIGLENAEIIGGGFRIRNQQQVIIRYIKFSNALSYAPGELPDGKGGILNQAEGEFTEVDAISIEGSEYIWIDHNEFSDDPWVAENITDDRNRHDGLIDIKHGSNWITVSNNIFRNHNKNSLVGHSNTNAAQDKGKLKVSYIGNWFKGTKQRNPLVRYGQVHLLNNLYTGIEEYGIGVDVEAKVIAEGNVFVRCLAWRHPNGTPNPLGFILDVDNELKRSWFNRVPSYGIDWSPAMYYNYTALPMENVEVTVRLYAGTIGKF